MLHNGHDFLRSHEDKKLAFLQTTATEEKNLMFTSDD